MTWRHALVLTIVIVAALVMPTMQAAVTPTPLLAAGPLFGNPSCDYSAEISIGNQQFMLIVDSGSSNTAVASAQCSSCGVSPLYDFTGGGSTIQIEYGDGSQISGPAVSATASFPSGLSSVPIQMIAVTSQNGFFSCNGQTPNYQGIIGLAYSSLAQGGVRTFMDSMTAAGMPDGFAVQFCDIQNQGTGQSGNYWLGGADTSYTVTPFAYASIVRQQYYSVQVNRFSIGPNAIPGIQQVGSGAAWIVDTGTTDIVFMSRSDLNNFVTAIRNSNIITFSPLVSQANINGFWQGVVSVQVSAVTINNVNLTVTFADPNGGEATAVIQTTNYIQAYVDHGIQYYQFAGFQVSSNVNSNILGLTLMKNLVTFFDRGSNNRIGFALGTNCGVVAQASGINMLASNDARTLIPSVATIVATVTLLLFFLTTTYVG